jgi:hypothetical protein
MHISVGLIARIRRLAFAAGVLRRPAPPTLPLLEYAGETGAADWLRASLTTFAERVASFLPDHFDAYVRIYHPFDNGGGSPVAVPTWRELTALAGRELRDPAAAEEFARYGVPNAQAQVGTLPPALIEVLVEHLRPATAAPEACYFAPWEGHGASAVPYDLEPRLDLPHRGYHVFAGPIEAAWTSYSVIPFAHQSANLWWPGGGRRAARGPAARRGRDDCGGAVVSGARRGARPCTIAHRRRTWRCN